MKHEDLFTPSKRVESPIKGEKTELTPLTDQQRDEMILSRSKIKHHRTEPEEPFNAEEFRKQTQCIDLEGLVEKLGKKDEGETEAALKKLAINAIKKNQYMEAKVLIKALSKLTDK